jgi:Icc-related predicted phosphoesterase
VKLLAFSDLHQDLGAAEDLVGRAGDADLVIAAGDFASIHEGLEETIGALKAIETPTVLVPGNNETEEALRAVCEGWDAATVLHGGSAEIAGATVFGLGAGIPITPWDWSFDLSDDDAAKLIADAPDGGIWALHSPPKGHCDRSGSGDHLGSDAIAEGIEAKAPSVAVCGHIHESWGAESEIGETRVFNLGPKGREIDV